MNKQPSLQTAIVAGLNLLEDPNVRMPASQAEGIVALRMLLQALANGQLVVSEPEATGPKPVPEPKPEPKPRAPRRTRAQMHEARIQARAQANGAAGPTAVAAPAATQ